MRYEANDLMLFTVIVEEGSFAKAAERLALPNSTLSRRMAKLEEQLGERLLIRTTRKMSVTPFGEAIFHHTKQMTVEMSAIETLLEHRQVVPSGMLRISLPGDFTQALLSQFLAEFIALYPNIQLDIDVSQRRVDMVAEGYDVALRIGSLPDDATLVARLLGEFEIGFYASPSYLAQHPPLSHPDRLREHALLRLKSDTGPLELSSGTQHWYGEVRSKTWANSPNILLNLALRGIGVTRLARHSVQPYVARGELVPVLPEWKSPKRKVWVVFPGARLMPARTRLFIDSLVKCYESLS